MNILFGVLVVLLAVLFAKAKFLSFRAQSSQNYGQTNPVFLINKHLSGDLLSEGVVFGPNGRVTNSFVAKMAGTWDGDTGDGDTGTLSEDFVYSNGRTQSRKWFLTLGQNNSFTATAADIVGTARGTMSGSTIKMTYKITLPKESGGHTLTAIDWLYLTQDGVVINRSELRKFGIKVAELVATIRPVENAPDQKT
ncbi:MAG: DUF3833 family protein [Maritimibacter sp.]